MPLTRPALAELCALPDMDPDEAALYGRRLRANSLTGGGVESRHAGQCTDRLAATVTLHQLRPALKDARSRVSDLPARPVLCTHRAWLARRTAELAGKEPVAVSGEVKWDGRDR